MDIKELEIPVPWGFVAAKVYGDEKDDPILTIHGLQDNAGTFDRLVPLLPTSFYYICIDLPGHGKSSHFPSGLPIHTINYVLVYKIVMEYFDRKQYIILGHSYGGQIGLRFAQLYPKFVKKLIMLDTVHMLPVTPPTFRDTVVNAFEKLQQLAKKEQPTYTYEEAFNKIQNRWLGEVNEEAAKALLVRAIIPAGDGKYKFTMDQRLKFILNPLHDVRYAVELLKKYPINCPILIVLAMESMFAHNYMKATLKEIKKQKKCIIKYVDGNHDVHNNTPELVAPHVAKFLTYSNSKL